MKNTIRGISCSLYNGAIRNLLRFLSKESFEFYVPWCNKIDNSEMLLPKLSQVYHASSFDLAEISTHCIWELVLQMFPVGSNHEEIETYDDFVSSSCICCLIYYDCGLLDVYVKDFVLLESIQELLIQFHAEDLEFITDDNDVRIALHV